MGRGRSRKEQFADDQIVEAIRLSKRQLGEDFPRIALFLFDCLDVDTLRKTIDAIPSASDEWIEEIVVMLDKPGDCDFSPLSQLFEGRAFRIALHLLPRESGFGAARKEAFEYALRKEFDHIIVMRGDGHHPPEKLPYLIHASLQEPQATILASRLIPIDDSFRDTIPIGHIPALFLASIFQNAVLAVRWLDDQSSLRLYATNTLRCIPYQLNANGRRFDTHVLIQLRALNAPVRELPVGSAWREFDRGGDLVRYAFRACLSALDYRAHQLHLSRRHRYMVHQGIHYTLKQSSTGSHMQIIGAIRPDSRVLDLGCSQGLLARPLAEHSVSVTGVDFAPPGRLADELCAYHQRNLELPIELPEGRIFDYVVVADVIEHLRNRQQLLRTARRFLKEDGRLIISTPNIAVWFYRLSLVMGRFEYGPRGILDETHVHFFTRATFRREVEHAGFHILKQRVTALPFEVVVQSTGRSRLVRWVARTYHLLARLWPSLFAYQFILEAEIMTLDEEATSYR